jgi:hypothetical protein
MYKQKLFLHGAKNVMKRKGQIKYQSKSKKSGCGIADIDKYLLSLVGGIQRLSTAKKQISKMPKTQTKSKYGGALRFVR